MFSDTFFDFYYTWSSMGTVLYEVISIQHMCWDNIIEVSGTRVYSVYVFGKGDLLTKILSLERGWKVVMA